MNPTLQLMSAHRSVRSYRERRLDDEVVRECVAAAQMAATSSNVQPYSLIRVEDPKTREALAKCCGDQSQVMKAGAFFIVCSDQKRYRLIAEDQAGAFEPNFETFLVGAVDTALFAQNLILAFESNGLGTCCIGGLRNDLHEVQRLIGLPADVFPLFGLCVGEAAEDPGTKPRLSVDGVLFPERYPSDDVLRGHVAEYDERMARYYEERGLAGRNWSGGVFRKWRKKTREYLARFYQQQGARFS